MKTSEKIYMADSLMKLHEVLEDVYDGYYIEEKLIEAKDNDTLGAIIEGVMDKIEKRIDEE